MSSIPRWTKHDPEVPGDTRGKRAKGPNSKSGAENYLASGSVRAWCYLCSSPHRFADDCVQRVMPERPQVACQLCGGLYVPGRRLSYCSDECRQESRRRRNRKRA